MSKDFPEDFPNSTRSQTLQHNDWSIINHFPSMWWNVFPFTRFWKVYCQKQTASPFKLNSFQTIAFFGLERKRESCKNTRNYYKSIVKLNNSLQGLCSKNTHSGCVELRKKKKCAIVELNMSRLRWCCGTQRIHLLHGSYDMNGNDVFYELEQKMYRTLSWRERGTHWHMMMNVIAFLDSLLFAHPRICSSQDYTSEKSH